ncbi:MAG: hypothetical protein E2P00_05380 [Acidobacteria bacterium]|nr:MAG: hypothetical protein E2P00_05380 [Acidobacteriota bacterium]
MRGHRMRIMAREGVGLRKWLLPLVALAVLIPGQVSAAEDDVDRDQGSLAEALKKGKVTVDLRYRLEQVSDDVSAVADDDATASTLRTTLAYQTARWRGLSGYVQFEDVSNLGATNLHNDTQNGISERPVIADPKGTELQQIYLRYRFDNQVDVTAGRVEFLFDDERFIGPVGWRQNHQSFDVAMVSVLSIPQTRLTYVYLDNVNTIIGSNLGMTSHLLNARIKIGSGELAPYVYILDYDDAAEADRFSTSTYGAGWDNSWKIGEKWSIPYHAQYAMQQDAGDNTNNVDVDYMRFEIGARRKTCWARIGYEVLEGGDGEGVFTTPLATLHKFHGWADRFLATPAGGLVDLYVAAGGTWGEGWSAMAAWHDFSADNTFDDGSGNMVDDYGTEFDVQVVYKASWKQTFGLKAALYSADDSSTLAISEDATKIWLWTGYKF